MRLRILPGVLLLGLAAPLAGQAPTQQLSFLNGCWEAPLAGPGPRGVAEVRFTAPSTNLLLGTRRTLVNGRTTSFVFIAIRADDNGITLATWPEGVRDTTEYRLAAVGTDTARFESATGSIAYRRSPLGLEIAHGDVAVAYAASACTIGAPTVAGAPVQAGPDRSGRVLTYVTQTLNGLWLGLAIPAAMDSEDETAYGLGLLLGMPAGIGFAQILNDARPVSLGQATTITWSGWWGLWNGIGISQLDGSAEDTEVFRNSAIGLVAGTAIGAFIARNPISAGDASLAAHASVWGTWYGIMAQAIIEPNNPESEWGIVLAAGNAALLAGAFASKKVDMSSGRVWITTASGLAGLAAGLGVVVLAELEDDAAYMVPTVSSFAGLATGLYATRNIDRRSAMRDFRPDQALLGYRDGRFRLGVPAPTPALVPRDDGTTRRNVPGLKFTLLDLRH